MLQASGQCYIAKHSSALCRDLANHIDGSAVGNSLINLGDLSKPATVLIEKVSDAVGGIAKPWQIKRVADAEAKADLVRAQARIEISEIEERALQRMVREEGKRQDNIEQITSRSIPLLTSDSKPQDIEDDWISNFFDKGRIISNNEMQQIWGAMLAGEANKPGTFSRRTVDLVASLDKKDADLFTEFCTFIWMIGEPTPLVFKQPGDNTYIRISFNDILHLNSIGLIEFQPVSGFIKQKVPDIEFGVFYYGKALIMRSQTGVRDFELGTCLLTSSGKQLANICGSKPDPAFYDEIVKMWIDSNLSPFEPIPRSIFGRWYSTPA